MIKYSPRSARALGFLKKNYNDIEVYVEDKSNPLMWLRLLRRILPSRTRLASVNALNGRSTVIEACRLDQSTDGRRRIYIIDGDFDHLRGSSKPRLKHLYRLRAYCIENLLLDERSVAEVACDASGEPDIKTSIAKLDLTKRIAGFRDILTELFCTYSAANEVAPHIKTVGVNVTNFLTTDNGVPVLCRSKLRKRIAAVISEVRRGNCRSEFLQSRRHHRERAQLLPFHMIVSGKDYIFPLIWLILKRMAKYSGSQDQLRIHLANLYAPHADPFFTRAVQRAAKPS